VFATIGENMFCSHCGKDLSEVAASCTCPQCGTPFVLPAPPKTGGNLCWLICGGILLVIVIALLITVLQNVGEGLRRIGCFYGGGMDVGMALHRYHEKHGAFPPLYTVDDEGKPLHSWRVLILPHMEQQELYKQIRLDEPWDSEYNRQFHDQMPHNYQCSSNPKKGCCYSAIAGGCFTPAKEPGCVLGLKLDDVTDNKSDILMTIEIKEPFCWMNPTADVTVEEFVGRIRVGSYHRGIMFGLFMDVWVKAITDDVPAEELRRMATPDVE
jgi:hypothetical protein